MVKTEHLAIAGAVGIAGIIGFSMLSPEEKDRIIPSGGIDLSGLFAGFKFPEFEFPDIVTAITTPFSALAEKGQNVIEDFGEGITNIVEAPGKFLETSGEGVKNFADDIVSTIVTLSPFGIGEEIGRRLPVGTFLGDLANRFNIIVSAGKPKAVSAPEFAKKTQELLGIRAEQTKIGRRKELAGVVGTLANIPKIISGGGGGISPPARKRSLSQADISIMQAASKITGVIPAGTSVSTPWGGQFPTQQPIFKPGGLSAQIGN